MENNFKDSLIHFISKNNVQLDGKIFLNSNDNITWLDFVNEVSLHTECHDYLLNALIKLDSNNENIFNVLNPIAIKLFNISQ